MTFVPGGPTEPKSETTLVPHPRALVRTARGSSTWIPVANMATTLMPAAREGRQSRHQRQLYFHRLEWLFDRPETV